MAESFYTTHLGFNDDGFFVGDGDFLLQLTPKEIDALHFARSCSQAMVDAFIGSCSKDLACGVIPSCLGKIFHRKKLT